MNIFEKLSAKNLDGIVITHPLNIFYLSGFLGDFGMILLKKSGQKILVTDGRYKSVAEELSQKNQLHFVLFDEKFSQKFAPTMRGKWGAEDSLTLRKFEQLKTWFTGIELVVTKNVVEDLRQTKSEPEIQKTRQAAKHIDTVLENFLPTLYTGITEKSAAYNLETLIRAEGKYEISFETIIAFGKNTASPHHHPNETKLEKNVPILIDCGAKFGGYCSDMTRNFWFGETIDTEYKNLYDQLLNIQSMANTQFISGKKAAEIDVWVRNKLGTNEKYFTHSLGHGTGLEVHEAPSISKKSNALLQTNQIVTNEPGVYISGKFGIRIEDQLIVKEKFNTKSIFTQFTKELTII